MSETSTQSGLSKSEHTMTWLKLSVAGASWMRSALQTRMKSVRPGLNSSTSQKFSLMKWLLLGAGSSLKVTSISRPPRFQELQGKEHSSDLVLGVPWTNLCGQGSGALTGSWPREHGTLEPHSKYKNTRVKEGSFSKAKSGCCYQGKGE